MLFVAVVQKNVKIRDSKFGVALVVETSAMVRQHNSKNIQDDFDDNDDVVQLKVC